MVEGELRDRLVEAYSEPHRRYHTMQHLEECFAWFDEIGGLAEHPDEVRVALWFHDAIYDPKRQDNEERSAAWARREVLELDADREKADRIYALVMATRHAAVPRGRDEEVLVDIDLSILGAAPARFDEYERQVREEYGWVPGFLFRRRRREILRELLARPAIFSTAPMRERLEARARANLEKSLLGL
jgi:predicted metal-dependent HD superfamily phosphohydrolase